MIRSLDYTDIIDICKIIISMAAIIYLLWIYDYASSSYYRITKKSHRQMKSDMGSLGEYLIYKKLRSYERKGARFIFNCYIPCNRDNTTEIDLLMIYKSGIYVFESKNYSGYIYGNEYSRDWLQILKGGHKEKFFNPVMQNKSHINSLRSQLEEYVKVHSIIVFSDRCKLKGINVDWKYNYVCQLRQIKKIVRRIDHNAKESLDRDEIYEIYEELYPFTKISKRTKKKHEKYVKKKSRRGLLWWLFRSIL